MKWVLGLVTAAAVLGIIAAAATREARHAEVKRLQAETRWLETQADIQRADPIVVRVDRGKEETTHERVERLGREHLDRKFMKFNRIFERAGFPELRFEPRSKRYQEERLEKRRLELEERRLELGERREKRIAEEAE